MPRCTVHYRALLNQRQPGVSEPCGCTAIAHEEREADELGDPGRLVVRHWIMWM